MESHRSKPKRPLESLVSMLIGSTTLVSHPLKTWMARIPRRPPYRLTILEYSNRNLSSLTVKSHTCGTTLTSRGISHCLKFVQVSMTCACRRLLLQYILMSLFKIGKTELRKNRESLPLITTETPL
jgi:hypothetical protein